jgi:hypothetical protein
MQTIAARFGMANWHPSTRERLFLLVVSVALSLASHVVFLRFLPSLWQRNESADYRVFYEPVARQLALGHGFYLPSGKPGFRSYMERRSGFPSESWKRVSGGLFWQSGK